MIEAGCVIPLSKTPDGVTTKICQKFQVDAAERRAVLNQALVAGISRKCLLQKCRKFCWFNSSTTANPIFPPRFSRLSQIYFDSVIMNQTVLGSGFSLKQGTSLRVKGFELRYQQDCNLVLYQGDKPLWASQSGTAALASQYYELIMKADGDLDIYGIWSSGTSGNPGAYLELTEYGVPTIYSKDGKTVLWTTGILPSKGSVPAEDRIILSPNKRYELKFQRDGDLVLYRRASGAKVWSSQSGGKDGAVLRMQDDGNLVIYTASDVMVWATNVYSKESFLKVDNIGYIYIGHGIETRVWTSLAENWMSYLPDNTKISDLSIPGTHSSCAFKEPWFDFKVDIHNSVKCQDFSVEEQLRMGVRFLDFSLRHNKNALNPLRVYSNGRETTLDFLQALEFCNAHLQRAPQEIIFVAVEDEGNGDGPIAAQVQAQMEKISNYLDSKMPVTLGEARGKVVLLNRYENATAGINLYAADQDKDLVTVEYTPSAGKPTQEFHFQDVRVPAVYQGRKPGPNYLDSIEVKWGLVKDMLEIVAISRATSASIPFHFNYASSIWYQTSVSPAFFIPVTCADTESVSKRVNERVESHLTLHRGDNTGFLIFDYITRDLAFLTLSNSVAKYMERY